MTTGTDWLIQIIQNDGLALMVPLAVIEGPIVSVIAGWLTHLGYLPLLWVYLLLVLADLTGDTLLYGFGRGGLQALSPRWRTQLGLTKARMAELAEHFRASGGRTLVIAKLTHSLGFAALTAAGAGRMPLASFLWFNLLGTLPKTLFFVLIGYSLGQAHATINIWIWRASILVLVGAGGIVAVWLVRRRRNSA